MRVVSGSVPLSSVCVLLVSWRRFRKSLSWTLEVLNVDTYIGGVASASMCLHVMPCNLSVDNTIRESRFHGCQKVDLGVLKWSASE